MVWRGTNILPQSLVEKDPFEILLFSLLIYKKEVMAVISNFKKYRADGLAIYLTMSNKTKQQKHVTWNCTAVFSEYAADHGRLQLWLAFSLEMPGIFGRMKQQFTGHVFPSWWPIVWVTWGDPFQPMSRSSGTSCVSALMSPSVVDLVWLIVDSLLTSSTLMSVCLLGFKIHSVKISQVSRK